jgi:uncharacterized BrkB/YihY/UPF0761 family membrane protein
LRWRWHNDQQMNVLDRLDQWQRRRRFIGFIHAVIRKYDDDQAGFQAALLTYYGFLALFPLLLILSTVTALLTGSHSGLQTHIVDSTTSYFPLLGQQLSDHVHSLHKSGLALLIGLLFTFYGARGVANAFRLGVNVLWRIPRREQAGGLDGMRKNFTIIVVGGLGFILAAICTSLTAAAGHMFIFRVLSLIVDVGVLFWLFQFLLNISLPEHIPLKDTRAAAMCAAIGLVLLQSLGGVLLKHELKNLDALYSYFALALGLLFWLYLQAQVVYFAVEIAATHREKLWPRGLTDNDPTAADKRAAEHQF